MSSIDSTRRADLPLSWLTLGALGALSIATPFLDNGLGLGIDVAQSTEVIDHVVPGAIILAASLAVILAADREGPIALGAAVLCFLSGLFMLTTHVPLVIDGLEGDVPLGGALFMAFAGPIVMAISGWLLVGQLQDPGTT